MSWNLPASLNIGGADFAIRTDFRVILDILAACNDPELPDYAKQAVMVEILYENWEEIPPEYMQEAMKKACEFIDCGSKPDEKKKPRMVDWEQDSDLIVPAVNKIAGVVDIRSVKYMHWWTFFGYFMEIVDGLFSSVLNIRYKKSHGKKLEKWEKEFYRENKQIIDFHAKISEEELARREEERKAIEELVG